MFVSNSHRGWAHWHNKRGRPAYYAAPVRTLHRPLFPVPTPATPCPHPSAIIVVRHAGVCLYFVLLGCASWSGAGPVWVFPVTACVSP